jgi:hypothetical protein
LHEVEVPRVVVRGDAGRKTAHGPQEVFTPIPRHKRRGTCLAPDEPIGDVGVERKAGAVVVLPALGIGGVVHF